MVPNVWNQPKCESSLDDEHEAKSFALSVLGEKNLKCGRNPPGLVRYKTQYVFSKY